MYRYPPTQPNDGWLRLYRLCLRLYPSHFRKKYGGEMTLLFRDCLRDARREGMEGMSRLWLDTVVDIGVSAPRAHLEEWTTMQASYTRSSQVGAIVAIISAVLLTGTVLGFGSFGFDAPNDAIGALVFAIFSAAWFGMIFTLYRRIQVAGDALVNKAGLGAGVLALLFMLTGAVFNFIGTENSGAVASIGLLVGLVALALLGVGSARTPELGIFRFALLLAALSVVALITLWTWWNEEAMWVAIGSAVLSLIGTGILLWTKSK